MLLVNLINDTLKHSIITHPAGGAEDRRIGGTGNPDGPVNLFIYDKESLFPWTEEENPSCSGAKRALINCSTCFPRFLITPSSSMTEDPAV